MNKILITFLFGYYMVAMESHAASPKREEGANSRNISRMAPGTQRASAYETLPDGTPRPHAQKQNIDCLVTHLMQSMSLVSGAAPEVVPSDLIDPQSEGGALHARSQTLIDSLTHLSPKRVRVSDRYSQVMARRHNAALNTDNRECTKRFSEALQERKITEADAQRVSAYIYGLQHMNTEYLLHMGKGLEEESQKLGSPVVILDGFASEMVPPTNEPARRRFINDARVVFALSEETSRVTEAMYRVTPLDFHGFMKVYLGLVRDVSGSLFAREQALRFTEGGEEVGDASVRKSIFSLRYLGEAERLLQMLDVLHPFAESAYSLGHPHFRRDVVEGVLEFGREILNRTLRDKHGIVEDLTLAEPLPDAATVPPKPKTASQKRREQKQRAQKRRAEAILEQKEVEKAQQDALRSAAREHATAALAHKPQTNITVDRGTPSDYTSLPSPALAKVNLKSQYIYSEAEATRERKAKAKQEKPRPAEGASTPSQSEARPVGDISSELTVTSADVVVKRVLHKPHKNGSKRLRPEHVKSIRTALIEGGYTPQTVGNLSEATCSTTAPPKKELTKKTLALFRTIHDLSFDGEMNQVTAMLRKLGATINETRSGSRIGFTLPKLHESDQITGTDLQFS